MNSNEDWLNKAEKLLKKFRQEGRKYNKFTDLEDLAVEYHKELGQLMMEGVVSDKGDGKNFPLPEEITANAVKKPRYKGIKKKV
jgi:hypothetical protein